MKAPTILSLVMVALPASVLSFAPGQSTVLSKEGGSAFPQQRSDLKYATSAAPPELVKTSRPKRKVRRKSVQKLERRYSVATIEPLPRHRRPDSVSSSSSSPGLTRDEEVAYAFRIRTLRAAMQVRNKLVENDDNVFELHEHSPTESNWAKACGLSVEDLRRLLEEGQLAREAFVAANIGLVTNIAKRQFAALKRSTAEHGGMGSILTVQDMVQEGTFGLMEAVERFQPEKGFRFSTYATWWVRQRILRSVLDSSRTIRLPAHVHSMLQKIKKARSQIKQATGRNPTDPELASHLEIPVEKIQLYTESSRNVLSLEKPLAAPSFKDDSRTIGDSLAAEGPTPEEDAEADHLRQDIRIVMENALSDIERDVVVHRYGLEDGTPRTMAQVADLLDLTTDRVRTIEARAINKLRHPQRNYRLKDYVNRSDLEAHSKKQRTYRTSPQTPAELVDPSRRWFF